MLLSVFVLCCQLKVSVSAQCSATECVFVCFQLATSTTVLWSATECFLSVKDLCDGPGVCNDGVYCVVS